MSSVKAEMKKTPLFEFDADELVVVNRQSVISFAEPVGPRVFFSG